MATYYVWSGAGGTASGADWTNAFTTFGAGVTAATNDADIIKVHVGHAESLGADTTYTFAANVRVFCVDKDNSDALAQMNATSQYVGHQTLNRGIKIGGNYNVYFYGIAFVVAGSTGDSISLSAGNATKSYENCRFWVINTSSSSLIDFTAATSSIKSDVLTCNCEVKFGHASQSFRVSGRSRHDNLSIASGSTVPTYFINTETTANGPTCIIENSDLSAITSTLVSGSAANPAIFQFSNCKIYSSVTPVSSISYPSANVSVLLSECASGDTHYNFAHYDAYGHTVSQTSIYADGGAKYDGTNPVAWQIDTTANASLVRPYISPWVEVYHDGTSAITPYLNCLRDNSSGAVYQDDEIWAEFAYQGTSGYTLGVTVRDRMTLLGTPADQASSSETWTGATGTPGKFKIGPSSSITPAEIGTLRARAIVGEPYITVYVDPYIHTS